MRVASSGHAGWTWPRIAAVDIDERDGEVAYLEYSVSDGVLELIHTEVPEKLRGTGLAATLAETGLQYARDNKLKVDVICPLVLDYVSKHPEYSDLIMH